MGKRSDFERVPRDFYPTPYEAVVPLLNHLRPGTVFCEPCAGDGALVRHLESAGHVCAAAMDIEPQHEDIAVFDARRPFAVDAECHITNPPWERGSLHAIIANLSRWKPTWLLFDADWMHTKQSAPFIPWLHKIVSVGRVKWIPDSKMTGKDNCAWYLFDQSREAPAQFVGRAA